MPELYTPELRYVMIIMIASVSLLCVTITVAIIAALARWIFRINGIIARMDRLIELTEKGQGGGASPSSEPLTGLP